MTALTEAVRRLWPAIEKAMQGLVFTTDKAGEVQADMNTIRSLLAEPAAPQAEPSDEQIRNAIVGAYPAARWQLSAEVQEAIGHAVLGLRPAPVAEPAASDARDDFNGDNNALILNAQALLDLDADGALVPHGIGGHARGIIGAFVARMPALLTEPVAGSIASLKSIILDETLQPRNRLEMVLSRLAEPAASGARDAENLKYKTLVKAGMPPSEAYRLASAQPPQPVAQGDYPPQIRTALMELSKACNARGFDLMDNSTSQKFWYSLRDQGYEAIELLDADRAARSKREGGGS